jgi:hypothetical protein
MTAGQACEILSAHCQFEIGKFCGHVKGLNLGAGLPYHGVRVPEFDPKQSILLTVERPAYVMMHECDIDSANERAFNDYLLIYPVTRVENFVPEYEAKFSGTDRLVSFLVAVAKGQVNRLVFLPAAPCLDKGGFLYLNALASTHVSVIGKLVPFGTVSAFGLQQIDLAITNHLLREKAARLALGTYEQ